MRSLLAALLLTGAGCSYGPPPQSTPPPPGHGDPIPNEDPPCNAGPPQRLVGRMWSEELAREAQRLAGARAVRPLRPGQIVTMEYRADRLNIRLDGQDRVEGITCG